MHPYFAAIALLLALFATAQPVCAVDAWRDPTLGTEFVPVPAGCFEMGDTFRAGDDDEKPIHEVCLDPFFMGAREITVRQFQQFVMETGYETVAERQGWCLVRSGKGRAAKGRGLKWSTPGFVQDLGHPVVCVAPEDAEAFAAWLGKKIGKTLVLPTEAQWEYAARAGGRQRQYGTFTGDITAGSANIAGTHGADQWERTAPVGVFPPNPLALYDMSGNVYEWTRDIYHTDTYGEVQAPDPLFEPEKKETVMPVPRQINRNPLSAGEGDRVKRGGSYALGPKYQRAANRGSSPTASDDIGFRLVLIP